MSDGLFQKLFDAVKRTPRECPQCGNVAAPGGYARGSWLTETVVLLLWTVMFIITFLPGVLFMSGIEPERMGELDPWLTPITVFLFIIIVAYSAWRLSGEATCARCGSPGLLRPYKDKTLPQEPHSTT